MSTHARNNTESIDAKGNIQGGMLEVYEEAVSVVKFLLLEDMKNKVVAAKAVMQRRRGIYWSFNGSAADMPLSPDGAQAEFNTSVFAAIDGYFDAVRAATH